MKYHSIRTLMCGAFAALLALPAEAVTTTLLPLQKGYVIGTCHSNTSTTSYSQNPDAFVVAIINGTGGINAGAPTNLAGIGFNWQRYHNENGFQPTVQDPNQEWTAGQLGEVFGITLDDASNPNIYVAATTAYGVYPTPAGNSHGTVYKLDGSTGDITPFNCIAAGNAGLGNLTYASGHLYVTNMDDGIIYQLDAAGNCVSMYDHGLNGRPAASPPLAAVADDPTSNFTPLDRRVWGIEAHQGRLFYGVWNTGDTHSVWSVALGAGGVPDPSTAQVEVALMPETMPVSDIAFAVDGRMFTAQRYHKGVPYGSAHKGRVLEFTPSGPSWVMSPLDTYKIGKSSNRNSAGGVDVECTGAVWASADALHIDWGNMMHVYGLQRVPAGGNFADTPNLLNSHIIDLDDVLEVQPKSFIGDVEAYDPCQECFDISEIEIECPPTNGEPFRVTFKITNRSDKTAHYIWHTPCPQADIPAGGLGGQPQPTGPQLLPNPIATGECTTVTVDLPAPNTGGKFYWTITLLDESGGECCTDKACIELPDCDCFIVLDKSIDCVVDAAGNIKYTLVIKLQNSGTFVWHHANLLPPTLFSPATFDLSASPVAPGDTYDLTTCVTGSPGDVVCFNLSVHSQDIDECCSKECCVVLPECEGAKPDSCEVTRVAPCCPDAAGGPPVANAVLTICNNSSSPRTYNWSMMAQPADPANGCPDVLLLGNSAFSPQSGVVNVGPNSCVNIPITILCEGLQPGARACYRACVQDQADPTNRFCCDGRVYVPVQPDPHIKDDPAGGGNPGGAGVAILVPGQAVRHSVAVINPTDRPVRFEFAVQSLGDAVEFASSNATTPGFDSHKRLAVDLEPFETEIVSMDLRAGIHLPFENIMIPIQMYPFNANGEVQDIIYSFAALAPAQQRGAPALKGIARNPDGTFTMTLSTNPGRTYRIESSQTLGSIDPWGPVTCSAVQNGHTGTEFVATGTTLFLLITPDPDCPDNFFRAVEIPNDLP